MDIVEAKIDIPLFMDSEISGKERDFKKSIDNQAFNAVIDHHLECYFIYEEINFKGTMSEYKS